MYVNIECNPNIHTQLTHPRFNARVIPIRTRKTREENHYYYNRAKKSRGYPNMSRLFTHFIGNNDKVRKLFEFLQILHETGGYTVQPLNKSPLNKSASPTPTQSPKRRSMSDTDI